MITISYLCFKIDFGQNVGNLRSNIIKQIILNNKLVNKIIKIIKVFATEIHWSKLKPKNDSVKVV